MPRREARLTPINARRGGAGYAGRAAPIAMEIAMTGPFRALSLSALLAALAACAQTETYPVTGRPCGPDDPVQDIQAGLCIPPG
jgi:hypothetical protein